MADVASFPPRTRARIKTTPENIKFVIGKSKCTYEQAKALIQGALDDALEDTIFETEIWIDGEVPKRSGDLRESIKEFLAKSRPPPATAGELRGVRLIIGIGVEIDYAKYVAEMTKTKVRHYNTQFEHSGKRAYSKGKPVILDDPRAEGFFFDKLVDYGIESLKNSLSRAKYRLATETSLSSRKLNYLEVT